MRKPRSAAQIAAAKRNLAKARHKPRTAAQQAADRRNLAKAEHKPRTAAQRAASHRNLETYLTSSERTYLTPEGLVTRARLHKNRKNTLKKLNRSRTLRKATGRTRVP